MATSCFNSDYEYNKLFPEEYNVVFSIKNGTNVIQSLSPDEKDPSYKVIILKGGAQPQMEGNVKVEVWSQEEVEDYNATTNSNFVLLPVEAYTLSSTQLHFTSEDRGKDVFVTFNPAAVTEYATIHSEKDLLVPLHLISEQSVDSEKKDILIEVTIVD